MTGDRDDHEAPMCMPAAQPREWHVEKRVTVGTIVAVGIIGAGLLGSYYDLQRKDDKILSSIDLLRSQLAPIKQDVKENEDELFRRRSDVLIRLGKIEGHLTSQDKKIDRLMVLPESIARLEEQLRK